MLIALTKSVKNHLTVSSLQPRGLVALISSLGTFSASWSEIEELNLEIEMNNTNDINNKSKFFMTSEDNKDVNVGESENKIDNKNDCHTLSFVFSETAERYFPDLSNAEIYQVLY